MPVSYAGLGRVYAQALYADLSCALGPPLSVHMLVWCWLLAWSLCHVFSLCLDPPLLASKRSNQHSLIGALEA
ncbi:hypothetical protein RJT34_15916 [Clitoria ternatea]|uniref:Uncharacterized protein n=1 Tax=Clitoria ternatea TaxID=43366 RepID=A0AAN9J6A2_CLITE